MNYKKMKKKLKKVQKVELQPFFDLEDKTQAILFAEVILQSSKCGDTLNLILAQYNITESMWKKALKKHKVLKKVLPDAEFYKRAYGERELKKMAEGGKSFSADLVKLYMSRFYNISDSSKEDDAANSNLQKDYKVDTVINKQNVYNDYNRSKENKEGKKHG